MKISENYIKQLFPPLIYKRGLDYYNNNQVTDLSYDVNHRVWTAMVHGTDSYFVEISLEKDKFQAYCDCPAFDTYSSCKHIAAVLHAIKDRKPANEAPMTSRYQYEKANRLIEELRSIQQDVASTNLFTGKLPMRVEYNLRWSYDKNLQIELRTGEKHCYVVKDLYNFLIDVREGNGHYFTKKFTYHPDTHYFLQQDLEIMELLATIHENEQIYVNDWNSYAHEFRRERRFMTIPPLIAKQLLEKLADRPLTAEMNGKDYSEISIAKGELPFHFTLTKTDEKTLLLSMDELHDGIYLEPYKIFFMDGVFYFLSREQIPIMDKFNGFRQTGVKLPVNRSQADAFLSEAVPKLEKIGDVNIAESIQQETIQYPLQAKLYLELKDEVIAGKLEYHYGPQKIDPFSEEGEIDAIVIRDVEKENQIMQLIEYANFHYNGKELYIDSDEEEWYTFLYEILPLLEEQLDLHLTSDIKRLLIDEVPEPTTNISLESSTNLLDIGFDIEGMDRSEIQNILNAVIEKKRYYRLQSGQILPLEGEEYASIQKLFSELQIKKTDIEDGTIQMPVYRSAQIDELVGGRKDYSPAFRKLLRALKSPEALEYPLPDNLHANLREYQKTGYNWFKTLSHYGLGGILADEMGLGKTLQSIAYIASEPSERPHLIVAPSSVVYNWKNELEKFAPSLKVVILTGTPKERRERMDKGGDIDVWITSYSTLRQDIDIYKEKTFRSMILDEAQYIKNYQTKTSRAIRQIRAANRFALSGTPIENSISELWSIFQVILPGLMPALREFKQLSNEKIASITRPFILRRLKKDVLKELPDKIESVSMSELTKEQKDLYVAYLTQVRQEAKSSILASGFQQNRMKILAGLTRLRQICCHPSLFIENYEGTSGKLEQLMETVKSALENGKRMLIFSQFTSMHEIIMNELEKEGIEYFYLHGQSDSKERVEMSERFNNGEKDVFLISLKAGGTGLNLTGADTVILYDLWWNPAVEDQATGRAHRFGQKNVVQVIRLISEGTIEEKIYELQQKKRELIDQVIQPGDAMLSSLSEDDVRELLSL